MAEEVRICESADYDWELILDGALALPPENNVEQTDWQADEQKQADISDSELDSISPQAGRTVMKIWRNGVI